MEHDYSVGFFKRLVDSYGRAVDACQGTVEVCAADQDLATERAKREFARSKDVADWSLRGDYAKVVLISSHKHATGRAKAGHSHDLCVSRLRGGKQRRHDWRLSQL